MDKNHWVFYGLMAALACSFTALFVKLSEQASITALVFARSALGLPIALWLIYKKHAIVTLSNLPKNLIRSLAGLSALYAWFYAAQRLPLIDSVTFLNTAPLFLPFILLFTKLLSSKWKFVGSILGFIGLAMVFFDGTPHNEWLNWIGLSAGFFVAIAYVTNRKLTKTETPETILAYYFLICPVASIVPLIIYWEPINQPIEWLYVILTGLFALAYQYILTKAYSKTSASRVGLLSYLSILFTGIMGWATFGEMPRLWALLGIVLIVLCALIAFVDQSKPEKI